MHRSPKDCDCNLMATRVSYETYDTMEDQVSCAVSIDSKLMEHFDISTVNFTVIVCVQVPEVVAPANTVEEGRKKRKAGSDLYDFNQISLKPNITPGAWSNGHLKCFKNIGL